MAHDSVSVPRAQSPGTFKHPLVRDAPHMNRCLGYGLLWGIAACCLELLGFPGTASVEDRSVILRMGLWKSSHTMHVLWLELKCRQWLT